jgi:molybdopterin-guanine dinucleotide biosynthesis protein A
MTAITGIVLAGGKGTRLGGCDKAFLRIDGEPIIARTLRTLRSLCSQTIVVTQHPERFRGLDTEVASDVYPGYGPLAGIHAGLLAAREAIAFVVACDMPTLEPDVVSFLVDRMGPDPSTGPDAIVPCWEGDVEPLHAVYAARCAVRIESCLRLGERSVRAFLDGIRVDYVPEAVLARLPGAARSFTNVNTPAELARLLRGGHEPDGKAGERGAAARISAAAHARSGR